MYTPGYVAGCLLVSLLLLLLAFQRTKGPAFSNLAEALYFGAEAKRSNKITPSHVIDPVGTNPTRKRLGEGRVQREWLW
jgi:hypothetical protein